MCDDRGWIRTLMEEAENERMHLMTFIEVAKPTLFERCVILGVQWVFYVGFFALYLVSPRTAHRIVGYFEEEAVISYTHYLRELDEGRSPNVPAPAIARHNWKLPADATLRDVVRVVRADRRPVRRRMTARRIRPRRTRPAARRPTRPRRTFSSNSSRRSSSRNRRARPTAPTAAHSAVRISPHF